MLIRLTVLTVSLGLAGCGGSDSSLFAGHGKDTGDAASDASNGASGGSSSAGGPGAGGASGAAGSSNGGGAAGSSGASPGGRGGSSNGSAGASGSAGDAANDTSTDAAVGDGDASNNGGASGAGGKTGSGGAGGKGGAANGGRGGAAGDGGPPVGVPTPMAVSCGPDTCTLTTGITNVCCALPLAFPPFPTGCFPLCVTTGVPMACDDAADCTGGNICCGSTTGSACAKTCPSGRVQFCRTDAECKSGTCHPWSTAAEYSTCQ